MRVRRCMLSDGIGQTLRRQPFFLLQLCLSMALWRPLFLP